MIDVAHKHCEYENKDKKWIYCDKDQLIILLWEKAIYCKEHYGGWYDKCYYTKMPKCNKIPIFNYENKKCGIKIL